MTHASLYIATCVALIGSVLAIGAPEFGALVFATALAVAILGVPHGGLDHWTGRALLAPWLSNRWWVMFFPLYLCIGIAFAAAWWLLPTATVLVFFLASAWHFGREDHWAFEAKRSTSHCFRFLDHVVSAAVGGLVIWIPALVRTDELRWLLGMIVPATDLGAVNRIIVVTQWLSVVLVPLAGFAIGRRIVSNRHDPVRWTPLATAVLAASTPVLMSFSVYFCGWHSVQGLLRLQRQERLSNVDFVKSILPLSIGAIAAIGMAGWWFRGDIAALTDGVETASLQTLFIGLSAIAVPHLLLHELSARVAPNLYPVEVQA